MKNLFFASFLLSLFLVSIIPAQSRSPKPRRTAQTAPRLLTVTDTDLAAGLAQTPQGYPQSLGNGSIPAQSTIGIYGRFLVSSGADKVILWSDIGILVVDARASRNSFPGLDMIVFRLPANLHGDVWITTVGRQASNTVKITVE